MNVWSKALWLLPLFISTRQGLVNSWDPQPVSWAPAFLRGGLEPLKTPGIRVPSEEWWEAALGQVCMAKQTVAYHEKAKKNCLWLVSLRLPEAGRERLEDNQAQKKGRDGARTQVWHVVMEMKCIKLSLKTFWHRHDVKQYVGMQWCQVNRLGQYTHISTLLPSAHFCS